ncbi:unnamed protein product [Soboliphyme baturini]|uniref:Uncharacterized protein n=1 Tax=Soboliphyme baturini TaxID=241478 RepID=A0A183IIA9_9BILA|nr:unnamed protein product [Soboliphyme baturini]
MHQQAQHLKVQSLPRLEEDWLQINNIRTETSHTNWVQRACKESLCWSCQHRATSNGPAPIEEEQMSLGTQLLLTTMASSTSSTGDDPSMNVIDGGRNIAVLPHTGSALMIPRRRRDAQHEAQKTIDLQTVSRTTLKLDSALSCTNGRAERSRPVAGPSSNTDEWTYSAKWSV